MCSLGRNGERYFLLVVDKGTEYLTNFAHAHTHIHTHTHISTHTRTKNRLNPVDLL